MMILPDDKLFFISKPEIYSIFVDGKVSKIDHKSEQKQNEKKSCTSSLTFIASLELLKAIHLYGWQQWNIIKGFIMHDL